MLHSEFTPHATITLCNSGGIEIMLNRSNDGVYYRYNYGNDLEKEEIYESEIFYTSPTDEHEDSEAYFTNTTGTQYFLNEAMKIS